MANADGCSYTQTLAAARDKIGRLQRSPHYHSFFSKEALDAFAKVENSAFAGKSLPQVEPQDSKKRR